MGCIFCSRSNLRPEGGPYTLDDLCDGHRREITDAADEHRRIHPDGRCTDTCGCMSLEELDARLEARATPATDQPEHPYAAWARQQRRIEASIVRAYESDDPGSSRQPHWERTANGEKI